MSHRCGKCNGTGRMKYTVHAGARKTEGSMDCVYCAGAGYISDAQKAQLEWEDSLWCKCKDRGVDDPVTYHGDDEKGAPIRKHHWTHDRCGKIIQIG